jgi:hypothetical protein
VSSQKKMKIEIKKKRIGIGLSDRMEAKVELN